MPEYLRKSQAERERAEREKNAVPKVRRMTMEDGAAVAEMEHQLFPDAWSEKSILETLEQTNTICLIAEKAGRTAGYLLAYTAADEAEIARIAVDRPDRSCKRTAEAGGSPCAACGTGVSLRIRGDQEDSSGCALRQRRGESALYEHWI